MNKKHKTKEATTLEKLFTAYYSLEEGREKNRVGRQLFKEYQTLALIIAHKHFESLYQKWGDDMIDAAVYRLLLSSIDSKKIKNASNYAYTSILNSFRNYRELKMNRLDIVYDNDLLNDNNYNDDNCL